MPQMQVWRLPDRGCRLTFAFLLLVLGLSQNAQADSAGQESVTGYVSGFGFLVSGKTMPGLELTVGGDTLKGTLETALLFNRKPTDDFDGTFLGNQLGAYFEVTGLRLPHLELGAGLGGDVHFLWPISSVVTEAALAPRVVLRLRQENLALTLTSRMYVLATDGLELGTTRGGRSDSPVLFTIGLSYRFDLELDS